MRSIVTIPYRGLLCRELSCQAEILMVATTRGRTMPLDRELVPLGDDDVRGLFVVVDELEPGDVGPTAIGIRAARELGFHVESGDLVYRAHWSACSKADRFRR
jgi:hypothetical protein